MHTECRVINPSYTVTFNSSRSTHTKDDIPDGIRNPVFEFDDDVNYKELKYCSSKDCDPVGMASFQICISGICQGYCSGNWC